MAADTGVREALSPGAQRVFFALWPDARVREELAQAARCMHRQTQGRRTSDDSIHLTLAYIGDVDAESLACLLNPPPEVSVKSFSLALDRRGCWARNGIGWAAPSRMPAALRELVKNLEIWLRGAGFALDQRPFTPHVTLIRRAQCTALHDAMTPIEWAVEEFALVQSLRTPRGSRYEMLRVWTAP